MASKQVGEVVRSALAHQSESGEQPASSSDERADYVWAMLAELYGPKFLDDNGDAPTRMWKVAVMGLTDAQLQRGFARLLETGRKWPPNAPEFVAECRHTEPVRYLGVPLTAEQMKNLLPAPDKQAKPETITKHLASMRATLGMKPKCVDCNGTGVLFDGTVCACRAPLQ